MVQTKTCSPACDFFKCVKKSAYHQRDAIWCRWTDELCNVSNCTYAICIRRRLLPRGICGETVKRKTVERDPEDVIGQPVRLKGKALRKIGDREIF